MSTLTLARGVEVKGPVEDRGGEVLTRDALEFVADLHRAFNAMRVQLLRGRQGRQAEIDRGKLPDFLAETSHVREGSWSIAPTPPDLQDRRVEITGPVERKMMINAFNCGAKVFMADFEDANSPTWPNIVEGQANLVDAVRRSLAYASPQGKEYRLKEKTAVLLVRPRGWHLVEKHVRVDGEPVSASLFDFGLYAFHNAKELVARGTGPYVYLPKLEGHLEARLWNDVFAWSERRVGIPAGRTKATVLIETILAAFEMEEILYELRDHAAGLNAGRWDYIFSLIKKFRHRPDFLLPDRAQVTMAVPFMRAYAQLLVQTCHRRGAHAIGGMAAFIPSRRDSGVNEVALAKVREDKVREASDGFDGTWIAHPDLVDVAQGVFDAALAAGPNQLGRKREDVRVTAKELLDVRIPGGQITEAGLRANVSVGIQYLDSWLGGTGAAALHDLMEDAATAEISRSQVWQWVRHGAKTAAGVSINRALVRQVVADEMGKLHGAPGRAGSDPTRLETARHLFERVALDERFHEFLTVPAYDAIQ